MIPEDQQQKEYSSIRGYDYKRRNSAAVNDFKKPQKRDKIMMDLEIMRDMIQFWQTVEIVMRK